MEENFSEILANQLKKMVPLLSSALLLLCTYLPFSLPALPLLRPDIGLMCVFFWSLYRQDLFGYCSVFILGFLAGSMGCSPLGLNIFAYLFIYVLCKIFGDLINMKSFLVNWIGFALVTGVAIFLKWILASIYYHQFLASKGIFAVYVMTLLLYPLLARFNMFLQNRFLAEEDAIYEQG